jgi:hypothetical protein
MPQSHFFPAGEALSDFAEAIWDADFDDARSARALTIKVLPTTSPIMIVHYRAAMTAAHRPRYKRTANGMQTRAMTLRPSGPLGVVLVRLKAEEACRVLGCDLADMTDASVELSDILAIARRPCWKKCSRKRRMRKRAWRECGSSCATGSPPTGPILSSIALSAHSSRTLRSR